MDKIIIRQAEEAQVLNQAWGSMTWFANGELGNSTEVTVGRCILKPGCGTPVHYHPNCTEILVVMSGRITHTLVGKEVVEMGPGAVVTAPPNIWHQAMNVGAEDAVLMVTFSSPNRITIVA